MRFRIRGLLIAVACAALFFAAFLSPSLTLTTACSCVHVMVVIALVVRALSDRLVRINSLLLAVSFAVVPMVHAYVHLPDQAERKHSFLREVYDSTQSSRPEVPHLEDRLRFRRFSNVARCIHEMLLSLLVAGVAIASNWITKQRVIWCGIASAAAMSICLIAIAFPNSLTKQLVAAMHLWILVESLSQTIARPVIRPCFAVYFAVSLACHHLTKRIILSSSLFLTYENTHALRAVFSGNIKPTYFQKVHFNSIVTIIDSLLISLLIATILTYVVSPRKTPIRNGSD